MLSTLSLLITLPLYDQLSWYYVVPPLFSDFNPKPRTRYAAVIITAATDFFVVCSGSLEGFFSPHGKSCLSFYFISYQSAQCDIWILNKWRKRKNDFANLRQDDNNTNMNQYDNGGKKKLKSSRELTCYGYWYCLLAHPAECPCLLETTSCNFVIVIMPSGAVS